MLHSRQVENVEVLLPLATDGLINHLLGQLESLYFALYDEISDQRKELSQSHKADIISRVSGFIDLEKNFTSYSQLGKFLQAVGQDRKLEGNMINFTMLAWIMEGARRAFQLEQELKNSKSQDGLEEEKQVVEEMK